MTITGRLHLAVERTDDIVGGTMEKQLIPQFTQWGPTVRAALRIAP